MKIHLITNLFHPDELAGAALYTDMAYYFKQKGHDIRVSCTFSYYPHWKLQPQDKGIGLREETLNGIPIRRLRMYVPRKPTGLTRLLSDFSFFSGIVRKAKFKAWCPDVVITACPMFSQCLAQRFMYRDNAVKRLIIIQDFVVDAALELGILKFPLLPGLLQTLEKWSFQSAETLSTISNEMLQKLTAIIGNSRKTVLIPNWIHSSLQVEIDRQAAKNPQRDKTTLLYSGNAGIKQGLPDFVTDFKNIDSDWRLKIYSAGADLDRLKKSVGETPNIKLNFPMEESRYIHSLLTATACLITQKTGVTANFLPSKLLPALAAGTPVLAVCDADSPLGKEVIEGGFGEVIPSGDRKGLKAKLIEWQQSPSKMSTLSAKALTRAKRYNRDIILAQYETELSELVQQNTFQVRTGQ